MCRNSEVNRRGPFGRRPSLTIKQCQDRGKGTNSHVNVVQGHDGVLETLRNRQWRQAPIPRARLSYFASTTDQIHRSMRSNLCHENWRLRGRSVSSVPPNVLIPALALEHLRVLETHSEI